MLLHASLHSFRSSGQYLPVYIPVTRQLFYATTSFDEDLEYIIKVEKSRRKHLGTAGVGTIHSAAETCSASNTSVSLSRSSRTQSWRARMDSRWFCTINTFWPAAMDRWSSTAGCSIEVRSSLSPPLFVSENVLSHKLTESPGHFAARCYQIKK